MTYIIDPFSLQVLERTEHDESRLALGEEFDHPILPLDMDSLYAEGNIKYMFPTIPMNT